MEIKFNTLTPNLWTTELDETIEFYTTNLGFQCLKKKMKNGNGHC